MSEHSLALEVLLLYVVAVKF